MNVSWDTQYSGIFHEPVAEYIFSLISFLIKNELIENYTEIIEKLQESPQLQKSKL